MNNPDPIQEQIDKYCAAARADAAAESIPYKWELVRREMVNKLPLSPGGVNALTKRHVAAFIVGVGAPYLERLNHIGPSTARQMVEDAAAYLGAK